MSIPLLSSTGASTPEWFVWPMHSREILQAQKTSCKRLSFVFIVVWLEWMHLVATYGQQSSTFAATAKGDGVANKVWD